ncbi:hypothetical protein M0R45_006998 [Rubus argutus]|uniref:Uncharacterized protein n=1 Tax=Rubus argutus TaxID=59490 RepID=A0AAW1YS48_RUBAR
MTTAREIATDLGAAWLFWAEHGQEGSIDGGEHRRRRGLDEPARVAEGKAAAWTARVMRTGVGWAGEHRPDEMMSELILNLVSSVLQVTAEDGFVVIEMLVN